MTTEEILELIKRGPGQNLEFLKGPPTTENSKEELAKTMVSFANSGDGIIIIGVDSNTHSIIGISQTCEITKEIKSIDENYCQPSVGPSVSIEKVAEAYVGIVKITRGDRPYYAGGDCYIRLDKSVYAASHSEIQNVYKKGPTFKKESDDSWPIETASYQDLDTAKIDVYLKNIGIKLEAEKTPDREKVLKDKHILVEVNNRLVPTAAALLVFGKNPQYFLISSGVRLVKFQGRNIGSIIVDQKEIKGTIAEMIDESWKFILKHINTGAKIESLEREDVTEYPEVAVREAITNAIVHRDYAMEGSQVRIFVFDDRIEIYTPGGLSIGVTVANMEYTQFSRNKTITDILLHTGRYIEKLGTGIRRIKLAVRDGGLREPLFFDSGVDFILTLFGPIEHSSQLKKQEAAAKVKTAIGPTKSPQEITALSKENRNVSVLKEKYGFKATVDSIGFEAKRKNKIVFKLIALAFSLFLGLVIIRVFIANSNNPFVLYHKAALLHNRGIYDKAIVVYSQFLKQFPEAEKADDAAYFMAGCLDILGEDIAALNAYADLLTKYPKSHWVPYAYYWRGALYLDLGELGNAITEYKKILQNYADHPIALAAMRDTALCFYKQEKFQEAINMYNRMLELTEFSSDGYEYYQMGLCYLGLGDKQKAKEEFERVIASERADPQLLNETKAQLVKLQM